ncbi:MAG: homoserine dehydrogenase [Clostridia bacterium]|nr:homoserine dehydrogenase [Clostridia bacterium]
MVNIAILGYGVVGSGVAEVINKNESSIENGIKNEIAVKYILDVRDFPGDPFEDRIIHDFSVIENDPDVQVVVETIGGVGVAYDFTRRALLAGKNVVTSNKELVATHGHELIELARERNLNYLFEASVGGGIPIIRPLTQCLGANVITAVYGILNGTTNYILTRMAREGVSFDVTLKEAQRLGYAEQDPSADIEGKDACRKIAILSDLAFGSHISPDLVRTEGITAITEEDILCAKALSRRVKLLGVARKTEDDRIFVYVAPHMIAEGTPIAGVDDVFNAIVIEGNAIDEVMFYGRGAGKLPTASAVVADVMDVAKHFKARKYIEWSEEKPGFVRNAGELKNRFCLRISDAVEGAAEKAAALLGELTPVACDGLKAGTLAFVTGEIADSVMEAALPELRALGSSVNALRLFK